MKDKSNFKKRFKKFLKDFWFLLWKDDSLKGWIFSLVFLFIFIKLIFFPGLNLITGTQLPLAIVESCSMYHDGNLFSNNNLWWDRHSNKYENLDLTKEQFSEFSFQDGFNKGDILFIIGTNPENLKVGDVIVFDGQQTNPIIHRIIEIKEEGGELIFSTIGDNNNGQLQMERKIHSNQIIGKAILRIAPYMGWGKLIFFELARPSSERGFCNEN
jgi:signal peptidase I